MEGSVNALIIKVAWFNLLGKLYPMARAAQLTEYKKCVYL